MEAASSDGRRECLVLGGDEDLILQRPRGAVPVPFM